MAWNEYPPYVSAAERRRRAQNEIKKRRKRGESMAPVVVPGRKIATTFWGAAWCTHLESYSDYENRLPRGRTYVRNGSVLHLAVSGGRVAALVQGSELYEVEVRVQPLPKGRWQKIVGASTGQIDSLIELLQGKLSDGVMRVVTDRATGLFPAPREIVMNCSCPDAATMCKHVAAVLYGVGARLDASPELLFLLREVNHLDLVEGAGKGGAPGPRRSGKKVLAESELGDVFGIEVDSGSPGAARAPRAPPRAKRKPR